MRMVLRRVTTEDSKEVADFLDRRTLVLRWLVAFFQNFERLPEEEDPYWSLWRGDAGSSDGLQLVAAHFFHNATTYVCADPAADTAAIEDLLDGELLPEKVVGDAALLEGWRSGFAGFSARVREWKEIVVLASGAGEVGGGEPAGFRLAVDADLPVLEEYGRLLEAETGEELARDFESLVSHGLVFVLERGGRIQGFVRSNFSDGRFVHAGGLYVHPLFRRRGVGADLARGIAASVGKSSAARVVLDAYEENAAALKAYGRAGFAAIGSGLEASFDEGAWQG